MRFLSKVKHFTYSCNESTFFEIFWIDSIMEWTGSSKISWKWISLKTSSTFISCSISFQNDCSTRKCLFFCGFYSSVFFPALYFEYLVVFASQNISQVLQHSNFNGAQDFPISSNSPQLLFIWHSIYPAPQYPSISLQPEGFQFSSSSIP